jgi:uncharacterized protein
MLDSVLMKILACPSCRGDVDEKDDKIICRGCGLRYPIQDGIPIMLIEEAEKPGQGTSGGQDSRGELKGA